MLAVGLLGSVASGLGRVLRSIPLAAWLLAGLLAWGAWGHRSAQRALQQARQDQAAQAQIARESERMAARAAQEAGNAARQRDLDVRRRAGAVEQRLHAVAAAWAASAAAAHAAGGAGAAGGAACGGDGAPAAAVLHVQTRGELVALAADADAVAGRLTECQRLVRRLNGEVAHHE